MALQHVIIWSVDTPLISYNEHRLFHEENISCTVALDSNSLCGGACQLEIVSAQNDDVLEEILNSVPEKIFSSSNNA